VANVVAKPVLIAHGGAGGRVPVSERAERRRALVSAVETGSAILRDGGNALDAVTATVAALENHYLFNAGFGSVLTLEGKVEMDAAVMVAQHLGRISQRRPIRQKTVRTRIRAGGVVLVSRVYNPVLLARCVMERTPHVLIGGPGAERLAREAGIRTCRPEQLITQRARSRWLASLQTPGKAFQDHGTVGATALDQAGNLAAATSTGGIAGKMPGRVGDSALIGAGLFADASGAASATGTGEAIMKAGLCREAVRLIPRLGVREAARHAIQELATRIGGEAGVIVVDRKGRLGYAHNAQALEVAFFTSSGQIHHLVIDRAGKAPRSR
jgi:beta-aspartyl-peptidase (threonine type)